jgi:putative PIN family toxin of toxin-antitoxin system
VRALLDTNVLVSAILFGGVPRNLLRAAIRGEVDLITSPPLLDELEEVLTRKFRFPSPVARQVRAEVETVSELVLPREVPKVLRDPDDDQVLAAAHAGAAEVIVTGDADLLELGSHEGVRIMTPREFQDLISR